MSQACPCGAPLGHHGSISVERLGVERCRSCADLPAETPGQTVAEYQAARDRGVLPIAVSKQAPERRRR